jgi:hypothetical protein
MLIHCLDVVETDKSPWLAAIPGACQSSRGGEEPRGGCPFPPLCGCTTSTMSETVSLPVATCISGLMESYHFLPRLLDWKHKAMRRRPAASFDDLVGDMVESTSEIVNNILQSVRECCPGVPE